MTADILRQVLLGYAPVIQRSGVIQATRLTVHPVRQVQGLDIQALLAQVAATWPAARGNRVVLNLADDRLVGGLLVTAQPTRNMLVEVPASMAVNAGYDRYLDTLCKEGCTLLMKGAEALTFSAQQRCRFRYIVVPASVYLRAQRFLKMRQSHAAVQHLLLTDVTSVSQLQQCFEHGAAAVAGWPLPPEVTSAAKADAGTRHGLAIVMELIARLDRNEPVGELEPVLFRDPTLAYRLVRYINSAAFGLSVQIKSFHHAIMMLGYAPLKRWLALMLTSADQGRGTRPLAFAAVRRGFLMEALGRFGGDEDLAGEMFLCGVFSLLDRMFGQPFDELLAGVLVPEPVEQALVGKGGAYWPYLQLVRAIEGGDAAGIRASADAVLIDTASLNRAILGALREATHWES